MNINDILDDAYASASHEKAKQDELVALREQNAALVAQLSEVTRCLKWHVDEGRGVGMDAKAVVDALDLLSKCKGAKP